MGKFSDKKTNNLFIICDEKKPAVLRPAKDLALMSDGLFAKYEHLNEPNARHFDDIDLFFDYVMGRTQG